MEKYFKLVLSVVFVFVLIGVFYTLAMRNVSDKNIPNASIQKLKTININLPNGKVLNTEVADTDVTRAQGLSGRDGLCVECGMLFIFPENGYYGFWMKDMNFNIDIVFLDENKQIVDIYKNADKNSYHQLLTRNSITGRMENNSQIYRNTSIAKYVLELTAYDSDKYGLATGNVLTW